MKPKTIFTIALVAFLCATVAYLALSPSRQSKKATAALALNPSDAKKEQTKAPEQTGTQQENRVSAPSKQVALPRSTRSAVMRSTDSSSASSQEPAVSSDLKILAYYFHGTQRCPTCLKLEAYSTEAIEKEFGKALRDGRLEWRVVNVDEPLNKHFVNDYQLYTKSLVIVKMEDGKQLEWKNLEKIWELVGDKDNFIKYVQEQVSAYLGDEK